MADGDLVADGGRMGAVGDVDACVVLHIAAIADPDPIHIASHRAVEPHAAFGAEDHITDDIGAGSDEIGFVELGFVLEKSVNHGRNVPLSTLISDTVVEIDQIECVIVFENRGFDAMDHKRIRIHVWAQMFV